MVPKRQWRRTYCKERPIGIFDNVATEPCVFLVLKSVEQAGQFDPETTDLLHQK